MNSLLNDPHKKVKYFGIFKRCDFNDNLVSSKEIFVRLFNIEQNTSENFKTPLLLQNGSELFKAVLIFARSGPSPL